MLFSQEPAVCLARQEFDSRAWHIEALHMASNVLGIILGSVQQDGLNISLANHNNEFVEKNSSNPYEIRSLASKIRRSLILRNYHRGNDT